MMRSRLYGYLLSSALMVSLGMPALAAIPTAAGPRSQLANGQQTQSELVVAKRSKKKRAKKKDAAPAEVTPAPGPSADTGDDAGGPILGSRRGPSRVDFDDRLIQGQTNKSGAIYIFERKSSDIQSMVRRRTSFREEIIRSIE